MCAVWLMNTKVIAWYPKKTPLNFLRCNCCSSCAWCLLINYYSFLSLSMKYYKNIHISSSEVWEKRKENQLLLRGEVKRKPKEKSFEVPFPCMERKHQRHINYLQLLTPWCPPLLPPFLEWYQFITKLLLWTMMIFHCSKLFWALQSR